MGGSPADKYSAGEQGLGYLYQPRFALLRLIELPEETSVFIEKDDDLDFIESKGNKTLASLKHKKAGGRLTDLSTDFWKSVRIWLDRYTRDGRIQAKLRFFLFTTETVSEKSFLRGFLPSSGKTPASPLQAIDEALNKSETELILEVKSELAKLKKDEKEDFFSRITIFDAGPRIEDIPQRIKERHMRSIRRENRDAVFERLEGRWHNTIIDLLTKKRTNAISGQEMSDALASIADEYKLENLPITFGGNEPAEGININGDRRPFVIQLKEINISESRIRNAILDYYRAFEERSSWARHNLLVSNETERYEKRLADEWERCKDITLEELDENGADEAALQKAGRKVYQWAEMESIKIDALRIRPCVTEPYVVRGGFHIPANNRPPTVYWHPHFPKRMDRLLGDTA